MEKEKAKKTYLAFIRISAGSSWYQSSDCSFELLAFRAVKTAVRDWKSLFKFKKEGEWIVPIFDVSNCKHGWQATTFGIFPILKNGKIGKRKIKYVKSITLIY